MKFWLYVMFAVSCIFGIGYLVLKFVIYTDRMSPWEYYNPLEDWLMQLTILYWITWWVETFVLGHCLATRQKIPLIISCWWWLTAIPTLIGSFGCFWFVFPFCLPVVFLLPFVVLAYVGIFTQNNKKKTTCETTVPKSTPPDHT